MAGLMALLALVLAVAGTGAFACNSDVVVVRLSDSAVLASVPTRHFSLSYRHSVTLSEVTADYVVEDGGTIHQTTERFTDLGPGMAHDGAVLEPGGAQFVVSLDRPIERLILRSSTAAANRLSAGEWQIDLTRWPNEPLEIIASPCTSVDTGTSCHD
jgi:hypothetical protein